MATWSFVVHVLDLSMMSSEPIDAMTADKHAILAPIPESLKLIPMSNALIIRRRWRSASVYFLGPFALIWNGFMANWMIIAIKMGALEMAAFGSLHAAIGIYLAYFAVTKFVNKTDIRIDLRELSVRHYPLWWPGGMTLATSEIQQIYCRERISYRRNGASASYQVFCMDRHHNERKLLSGLPEAEHALYIEHEIERTLGLDDKKVMGEIRK